MPVAIVYAGVLALWFFADLSKRRVLFYAAFDHGLGPARRRLSCLRVADHPGPRRNGAAAPQTTHRGLWRRAHRSAMLDVPTGAAVVCALALAAIVFASLRSVAPPAAR
jgi:hypothetical protein